MKHYRVRETKSTLVGIDVRRFSILIITLVAGVTGCDCCRPRPTQTDSGASPEGPGAVTISETNYLGWSNAYLLRNHTVEAIVVPGIGRVLQFGFRNESGVFWHNRNLEGKPTDCKTKEWINLGGDKTWPAPESDWSKFTGASSWHPPQAFDCMPLKAEVRDNDLILTSPVDPHYGISTVRRVHLAPVRPEMTITTTYKRISGTPAQISIWVITQLKEPVAVYVPRNQARAAGPEGPADFMLLGKDRPSSVKTSSEFVSLLRSPTAPYKLGFQSSRLLWVGEKYALQIESPRGESADYPDHGSSAEVYTNPDPLQYVELEMLGPLHLLRAGESIEQVNKYTLHHRQAVDPDDDARRILGLDSGIKTL